MQWSPDGKRIAYVAKGEPSGQQIFVRWMDAEGAVTQISHLTESAVEPRVVAGRQVDRVHDERAGARQLAHRDADAAEGRQVDRVAQDRHAAQLSLRSRRLHRRRLPSHLRHSRRRRHAAPDHERRLEPLRAGVLGRRQVDRVLVGLREPNAENVVPQVADLRANLATGEIKQLTHRSGTSGNPVVLARRQD